MSNRSPRYDAAPRILPVLPLPNTVCFPHTILPLHVFEPRYQAMIRDVSAGDGLTVVALEAGAGFMGLGTVGRIRSLEPLDDGRFNLRLEGLERVALVAAAGDAPYPLARVEPRPERTGTQDTRAIDEARRELLASYGILHRMLLGNQPLALHEDLPFEVVVNMACAGLPIDAASRQRLLTEDSLMERQRQGLEYVSVAIEMLSWMRATKRRVSAMMN